MRGLMLLIGVALLTSGLVAVVPHLRQPLRVEAPEFIYENVAVILPVYVEQGPVDVNSGSVDDLVRLPGIGETLAARIIAYREAYGPFASLDDLQRVSGIGPATVDGFRDHAYASSRDQ